MTQLDEDAVQADARIIDKAEHVFQLQRTDGKPLDETFPRYVVEPKPLNDRVQNTSPPLDFWVILSDFGAGMSVTIIGLD